LLALGAFPAAFACRNETPKRAAPIEHTPSAVILAAVAPDDQVRLVGSSASPTQAVVAQPAPSTPSPLFVPRAAEAILPSEEFEVRVWEHAVNTHTLLDAAGHGAVPVSEARFLWGQGKLYVNFYAGDLDLQIHTRRHDGPTWKDDALSLSFPQTDGSLRIIAVSAVGVVSDGSCPTGAADLGATGCTLAWESHTRAAADYDGTINQIGDRDEEWNLELAIPLGSLGVTHAEPGTHVAFYLRRCEIAYDGPRQCGRWGTAEMPAELVLQ
jgi:hypothetical protein